ncbi:MAG: hypothetical protein VYE68_01420 [Acidobacteriota bacterium]|nr:hypothetical protein [Acidobacteriota bacterium]
MTSPRQLPAHRSFLGLSVLAVALIIPSWSSLRAQTPARGQNIAPVYEGFWINEDGSYDLLFGYYNRNWQEEIDLPVGANNYLEPGDPDRGQPTHFYPRRNQFVFRVRVPADFGDQEVVWSLTSHGVTEKAYGTLRPQYAVDETVMTANFGGGGQTGGRPDLVGNVAPQLTLEGPKTMSVSAGDPVTLSAVVVDDGKPTRRPMPAFLVGQSHFVPNSATGLRLTWFRYRGPGAVTFDPPQPKVWQDTRDGGNSPWSVGWEPPPLPPEDRWVVQVTFREAGTYVLRALAHDGGLVDYDDIAITVTR